MGEIFGFIKLIYRLGADPWGERQGWQSTGSCSVEKEPPAPPSCCGRTTPICFLEPEDWVNSPEPIPRSASWDHEPGRSTEKLFILAADPGA